MTLGEPFASQELRISNPGADMHERDGTGGRRRGSENLTARKSKAEAAWPRVAKQLPIDYVSTHEVAPGRSI